MNELEYDINYYITRFDSELYDHWTFLFSLERNERNTKYHADCLSSNEFYLAVERHDYGDDYEYHIIGWFTLRFDALDYIEIVEAHRGKGKFEPIMHCILERGITKIDNMGAEKEVIDMIISKYGLTPTLKENDDGSFTRIQ